MLLVVLHTCYHLITNEISITLVRNTQILENNLKMRYFDMDIWMFALSNMKLRKIAVES